MQGLPGVKPKGGAAMRGTGRRLALGVALVVASGLALAGEERKEGKVFTDRWYAWSYGGDPSGCFHVIQKESGEEGAPVLLVHEFVAARRGKRLALTMQTFSKDDAYFSPVKIISQGEGDDELKSFTALIERQGPEGSSAGKLVATVKGGKKAELAIPEHTVTDFALFEVVRRLPFDKEKAFEFNSLEASELNLKKNHKLSYLGQDELTVGDQVMKLHKFEESGEGINPIQYWVNDERELVRVVMDGRKEFLLTTEEKAKKFP
jgi:hypothetical protein